MSTARGQESRRATRSRLVLVVLSAVFGLESAAIARRANDQDIRKDTKDLEVIMIHGRDAIVAVLRSARAALRALRASGRPLRPSGALKSPSN